jgi:hypothetical protein
MLQAMTRIVVALCLAAVSLFSQSRFPLRVSPDRTHLVDAAGKPFLVHGDSPWEIVWNVSGPDAELYLDNRLQRGFNAILADVLPYSEWSDHVRETNRAGQNPFLTPGDLSTPNEVYFQHLDWFLTACEKRGLLVALVAADLGHVNLRRPDANGGMWWVEYKTNGPAKCRDFGRYLGKRYGNRPNVLWILGGDRDPGDVLEHVEAMAQGLEETAPGQLKTYHAGAKSSTLFFHTAPWLDVNASYGYTEVWQFVQRDAELAPRKPNILFESGYELESNDGRGGAPQRIRRQAWGALLAGACGDFYGSVDWKMNPGWKDRLDLPGANQLAVFKRFFDSIDWTKLHSSFGSLVQSGEGSDERFAPSALSADKRLAVIYMPTSRRISVNLGEMAKGSIKATWLDPVSGAREPAGDTLTSPSVTWFQPPPQNAGLDTDYVLVLTSTEPIPGQPNRTR